MEELKQLLVKFVIDTSEFKKGIAEIKDGISKISKTKINTSGIDNIGKSMKKASKDVKDNTSSMTKNLGSLGKSFKSLGRLSRFFVFNYAGRQMAKFTKELYEAGANMTEIQNLFEVSFDEMADSAEAFAKKLERSWGVSATTTKQQTAYLNNMFKSMGMTEKQAYGMSTGLVQLSHNMASLYDISQVEVLYKLRSAMVGISRPLLQLGINTKVAELQDVALRNGIISTTRELTQQEKVLATYWAIWEQTRSAWASGTATVNGQTVAIGDMTKTLTTNANMARVISNRLGDLRRAWGIAFQPIANFVLPLVYVLTNALIKLGQAFSLFIGRLFGFKFESFEDMAGFSQFNGGSGAGLYEDMLEGAESVEDANEDMTDSMNKGLDSAKKKVDKLTGAMDELNILQEPESAGNGLGLDLTGIENDIGLPNFDTIIDDYVGKAMDEVIAKIKEKFSTLIPFFKDLAKGILGALTVFSTVSGIGYLIKNFDNLRYHFTLFKMAVVDNGFLKTFAQLITSWISPIGLVVAGLVAFVGAFAYLLATSEEFRNNMISYLNDIWGKFIEIGDNVYNNFIAPLVESFSFFISSVWDNGLALLVENISYLIGEIMLLVSNLINFLSATVLPTISAFIDRILKAVAPIINVINQIVANVIKILTKLISFINGLFSTDWANAWQNVVNIFGNVFGGISEFVKNVFNTVVGMINRVIDAINSISVDIPDWVPLIGGSHLGFNFSHLPYLEDGGIAYGETLAMVGEYANASSNPEVIAPLDRLQAIMENSSSEEQNDLLREQNDLLRALLDKDTDINIDGRSIAKEVNRNQNRLGFAIMR